MFISKLDYQKSLNDAIQIVMLNSYYQLTGVQLKLSSFTLNSKKFKRSSSQVEFDLNVENVKVATMVFHFEPGFLETINFDEVREGLIGVINTVSDSLATVAELARSSLLNDLLEKLNSSLGMGQIVSDLLTTIKVRCDFDAVGIRFADGEDYPYYEVFGFENKFVEAENYLCERDSEGKLIRNSDGTVAVACMCGNILCGRVDASYPFFTEGGSFWTNSTTKLLASTSAEERQSNTRNRCNTAGYESVALIPLRANKQIKGLLQINHKAENAFSLPMIEYFERVSALIAIAIERKELTEKLLLKGKLLDRKLEEFNNVPPELSYS